MTTFAAPLGSCSRLSSQKRVARGGLRCALQVQALPQPPALPLPRRLGARRRAAPPCIQLRHRPSHRQCVSVCTVRRGSRRTVPQCCPPHALN